MFKKGWQPKEYKGVHDEIRQQHMKTKDMSTKGKLEYFWYYYKIHTLIAVTAVVLAGILIHDIATAKDYSFYAVMMNASLINGEAMEASFGEYAGLDMEQYDCFIDTTTSLSYREQSQYDYATQQKLIAQVQTRDLDAVVMDGEVFNNFAFNYMFTDLREIFSAEELDALEGKLFYIDNAAIRAAEEAYDNNNNLFAQTEDGTGNVAEEMESHRHPESMDEPVPVGVFLDSSSFVRKTGSYSQLVPVYGFIVTGERTETAKKYLDFLLDESIPFENMTGSIGF